MAGNDKVFVDTWGWLALGHAKDPWHNEVVSLFKKVKDEEKSFYTSDYILDELITLLFRREHYEEAVRFINSIFFASDSAWINILKITSEHFSEAWKLREKLDDKPKISFTDLTSAVVMKSNNIQTVLTDDDHFLQIGYDLMRIPDIS